MGRIGLCLCTKPEGSSSEPSREYEAPVGKALERVEQVARLGLWKRGRTVGLGGPGTCGRRQVSEHQSSAPLTAQAAVRANEEV